MKILGIIIGIPAGLYVCYMIYICGWKGDQ
jgi:hypothetical protein